MRKFSQTTLEVSKDSLYVLLIVCVTYWILVMGMWGIFSFSRGLTFESIFPIACQKSLYDCLIYGDNLRPYNSLFLGFSHLLSGGNGSYISYQLLYGLLWWGRGVVVFLIFQCIFPNFPIFGFIVGALTITHSSDGAINWVGQIHQLGFLFFLALATYFFLKSWFSKKKIIAFLFLNLSIASLHISLWTYESQYFIILTIPGFLFLLYRKFDFRFFSFSFAWYALPLIYGVLQVQRYALNKAATYQSSIARSDITVPAILQDLSIHIIHSLKFWEWGTSMPNYGASQIAVRVGWLCAIAFVIGAYLLSESGFHALKLPKRKFILVMLGIGFLTLILSFPIYLLLAGNTNFWRTQMLSVFGTAIVLGTCLMLITNILVKRKHQALVSILLCAVIIFFGVRAGVFFQAFHGYRWQIHRSVMAQVSQIAPDVKDHTLILLTNMPKEYEKDPFGASMWFDAPINLLYPNKQVVGHYFYADGSQPSDNKWEFTIEGLKQTQPGFPKEFESATYDQMLVLKYGEKGKLSLMEKPPLELLPKNSNSESYNPANRIEPRLPSENNIRMFSR